MIIFELLIKLYTRLAMFRCFYLIEFVVCCELFVIFMMGAVLLFGVRHFLDLNIS